MTYQPTVILLLLPTVIRALPYESPPLVPSQDDVLMKRQFDQFSEKFLQPDDFDLAEKTPVDRPTSAQLDAVQNSLLFEGDIVGMPSGDVLIKSINADIAHLRRLRDDPMVNEDAIFSRPYHSSLNLVTYPDKLWADGRVPYVLEEGMTKEQRAAIAQAFDEYKTKTCVRFVPREEDDEDFIYLKRNVAFGCSSYVGRAGGNQTVSLEIDKCFSKGIIAHELMHSLGFFHEHSRTDRDQFVHIADDNIRGGMMRNFEKYPRKIIDPLGMPYDYESVMHYHKLAFSKNGKATIVPKDPNAEIGQRYRLSETDAAKINKLYACSDNEIEENSVTTKPTTRKPKSTTKSKSRGSSSTRWPSKKTSTTTEEPTTTEEEEVEEETTTRKATTQKPTTSSSRTRTTSGRWTMKKTTTEKPEEKTTEKKEKECVDLNAHCEMWESLGHCQHSTKYMAHYCRKSCNMCDKDTELVSRPETTTAPSKTSSTTAKTVRSISTTTTTTTPEPPTTQKRTRRPFPYIFGGSSTTEKPTTSTTTEKATTTTRRATTAISTRNSGSSSTCRDKNLFCSYWAKIGECSSESKFMRIFCKKSCDRCEE
ncbi:hypothetical protein PENTCL1PPCAC_15965 [Pristionchus entomophagus]|uniref:Metalloendopeptidase n=1 Tax=Pristionchus entomophagus TaxID=358040 RepID=A0AAV5THH6_9BILA|nr:hypothetical protein PENTCL1PPCAC_15965 [Pristionchus entomophagus]